MKQKFFGVNEIHTYQHNEKNGIVYLGMQVQGLDEKKPKEFVMMFHEEDLEYLVDFLQKSL